jgi:F0F1-type ATP synthase membrane subunit a
MSDTPDFRSLGARLLAIIPALILVVFANVLIAFSTAGVVLVQLLAAGYNKHASLGVALLVAIGVHAYIVWNHKIRNYIKQGAKNE